MSVLETSVTTFDKDMDKVWMKKHLAVLSSRYMYQFVDEASYQQATNARPGYFRSSGVYWDIFPTIIRGQITVRKTYGNAYVPPLHMKLEGGLPECYKISQKFGVVALYIEGKHANLRGIPKYLHKLVVAGDYETIEFPDCAINNLTIFSNNLKEIRFGHTRVLYLNILSEADYNHVIVRSERVPGYVATDIQVYNHVKFDDIIRYITSSRITCNACLRRVKGINFLGQLEYDNGYLGMNIAYGGAGVDLAGHFSGAPLSKIFFQRRRYHYTTNLDARRKQDLKRLKKVVKDMYTMHDGPMDR